MQIEIPNELGFAILKLVPSGVNVQEAAVALLSDAVEVDKAYNEMFEDE